MKSATKEGNIMSEKSTEMASLETKAGLLEYLKRAIALESSMVTQKQVIDDYDESSKRREPILELKEEENNPPCPDTSLDGARCLMGIVGLITIVVVIGAALSSNITTGIGGPVIIGLAAGTFLCFPAFVSIVGNKAKNESYLKEIERIKETNKQIKEENRATEERYQNAMSEWRDSNENAHEYFSKPLSETQSVLEKLYSADVIYPKYRTLPALTSIYEYLVTGRCEELSGAHGAYNLYEDEVRKDTVISQLNTVIENLEQIKQNQYMLYEQVKGIQQNTRAIAAELYQIKGYTACLTDLAALTAFYSGVAATNTSTLTYCQMLA